MKITIPDIIKTSRPGSFQPLLILPYFTTRPELCVARAVQFYLQVTKNLRKEEDRLFLAINKSHKAVTTQTISRWIKTVLSKSGVDTEVFTAHSTRHVATVAFKRGLDINSIRNTAGWSQGSQVFAKFYNRPMIEDRAILASAVLEQK